MAIASTPLFDGMDASGTFDEPRAPGASPVVGGSLSTTPPRPGERRLALATVLTFAIVFLAAAPFARMALPPLPAFVPIHQTAIAISALITAALLLGQFGMLGSAAVLALAIGYLLTGFLAAAHVLTFPGLFAPDGMMQAGPQGTLWLYMASHAAFAAAVIAYVLLGDRRHATIDRPGRAGVVVAWSVAGVLAATYAVMLLVTAGRDLLPVIIQDDRYTPAMLPLAASVWALNLAALVTLWRRKPRSVLDLWILVATCAWLLDIALAALLNAGRFDLGYYAGRAYGFVGATFVLLVLLIETGRASNRGLQLASAQRTRAEREAVDARHRLAGIIDSAMDAIITVDDRQQVVLFNATAVALFGCPQERALGAPISRFIPERFRHAHAGHVDRFGEGGVQSRRMGSQRIVTGLRSNGEEFPIDAAISQVSLQGRKYYTVILRDVTERQRAEDALRRSEDELRHLADELRHAASAGATAREQEKSRIARELHDELAQSLAMLRMDLIWIKERDAGADATTRAKLDAMQKLLDESVAATRRVAADLRPLVLDDLGLVPAVEWLTQKFEERYGIDCVVTIAPPDLELADPYATAVFRILQEALANVARHAGASRVDVELRSVGGEIHLGVRDDGHGFDPSRPRKPGSFGLVGLRERVHLVDGRIAIESAPGQGTRIDVRIPLPPKSP
jgi:PAS domain S-box-containing protein